MERTRIIQGDCIAGLDEIEPGSIDAIFTDPPYNIGVKYGNGHNDKLPLRQFQDWCLQWIMGCSKALKPGGSFWLLCSDDMADWIGPMMRDFVGPRRRRIIWQETFAQYQQKNFTCETRHLFYHVKPGAAFTWNPDAIRIPSARQAVYGDKRANSKGRVPGNVWKVPRVCGTFKARTGHPAQLPIALVERCILSTSNRGDLILDPFLGSGTTLEACARHGRDCIGFEQNPEFVEIAAARRERGLSFALSGAT